MVVHPFYRITRVFLQNLQEMVYTQIDKNERELIAHFVYHFSSFQQPSRFYAGKNTDMLVVSIIAVRAAIGFSWS